MDLISRQAAIAEIKRWMGYIDEDMVYRIQTGLKKIPSAQPEIVRCSQCKYAEVADQKDSQDGYTCQFHRGSIWFSGSYCSWAERRTDV